VFRYVKSPAFEILNVPVRDMLALAVSYTVLYVEDETGVGGEYALCLKPGAWR